VILSTWKNFSRKAFEYFAHVLMWSLLVKNHCFTLSHKWEWKWSSMMSWATSLMTTVLLISGKFWRWALASSYAFPLNGIACTLLMRLGLSSNSRLLVLSVGLWMFSVLRAENSRRVLSAIALEASVELSLDVVDSDWWDLLNHNQSYNTLYKIWTKTNKGKPAKAKVMIL
jgi:hypothetical protein